MIEAGRLPTAPGESNITARAGLAPRQGDVFHVHGCRRSGHSVRAKARAAPASATDLRVALAAAAPLSRVDRGTMRLRGAVPERAGASRLARHELHRAGDHA